MQDRLKSLITDHLISISHYTLHCAIRSLLDTVYANELDNEPPSQLQLCVGSADAESHAAFQAYNVEDAGEEMRVQLPDLHCDDVEVSEQAATSDFWHSGEDQRGFDPIRAFYVVEMYKGNLMSGPFYEKLQPCEEAYEVEEATLEPSIVHQELDIDHLPRFEADIVCTELVKTESPNPCEKTNFEPAHPSDFIPKDGLMGNSSHDDTDFVQMQDNLIASESAGDEISQQILEHVQNVTENLLNNVHYITANNRFMTPLLAEFVRQICSGEGLSDVQQYLSSSMQLPVYYSVHEEASGFLIYQDVQDHVVALADRYVIIEENYNDDGQFGLVMVCYDIIEREYVAVKKCKSPEYFAQLLNEIRTLLYINCHDKANGYRHFCHMKDFFIQFSTLFIVFEFLGDNLYQYSMHALESRVQIFSIKELKQITRALLDSVQFLQKLGILHFDIKPENIVLWSQVERLPSAAQSTNELPPDLEALKNVGTTVNIKVVIDEMQKFPETSYSLDNDMPVKLIDIGSHQFFEQNIVPYVESRFYRAPEVFLKIPYDGRTESFSLGCVLYELLTGKPLFVTNVDHECYAHELASFVGLLGPIPEWMILAGTDSHKYFTEQYEIYCDREELIDSYVEEFGCQNLDDIMSIPGKYCILKPLRCGIRELLANKLLSIYAADELDQDMMDLVDFIEQCLQIDMKARPYPEQLAELPWAR